MVRDRRMMGRERSELSYSVVHVHDVGKFTLYGAVDMQLHLKLIHGTPSSCTQL